MYKITKLTENMSKPVPLPHFSAPLGDQLLLHHLTIEKHRTPPHALLLKNLRRAIGSVQKAMPRLKSAQIPVLHPSLAWI